MMERFALAAFGFFLCVALVALSLCFIVLISAFTYHLALLVFHTMLPPTTEIAALAFFFVLVIAGGILGAIWLWKEAA